MKIKILLITALTAGILFTGCSDNDDNSVTVDKTYGMYVGQGFDSHTGTDAPVITALENTVTSAVQAINSGLVDFPITGKGKNEEEALANAENQAVAAYNQYAENIILQLITIKSDFETNRKLNAAKILAEPANYRTKLTLRLYLVERIGEIMDPVIKQSDSYYMEAIAGVDYSSTN